MACRCFCVGGIICSRIGSFWFTLLKQSRTNTHLHSHRCRYKVEGGWGCSGICPVALFRIYCPLAYITHNMAVFLGHVIFPQRQTSTARTDAERTRITGGAEPLQYQACNKCADFWQACRFGAFFSALFIFFPLRKLFIEIHCQTKWVNCTYCIPPSQ